MMNSWPTKKLGEVINPQYGYTASAKDKGNFRFVRITDINEGGELKSTGKKYVSASLKEIKNYILSKGDLLVARTGSIGRMLYFDSDEPAIFASYLIRLKPDISQISPKYLWIFSHTPSYWGQVGLSASGAVQPQFNANRIKMIKILLPPLKTQQQIIDRLDAIRKAIELNDKQIALAEELFQSLLEKELDSRGKGWEVKRLGEVTVFKRGPFGGSLKKEIFVEHGYKVYEQKNAIYNDFVLGNYFISEEKYREMIDFTIHPGDLIVSCSGTIGKVAKVPADAQLGIINQALLKITPLEDAITSDYLKFILETLSIQRQLTINSRGAAIQNVASVREIKRIKLPLPPLQTQRQIVEKLQAVQDYRKKLSEQKRKLQELFSSYLDRTMKGKLVN